MVTGNRLEDHGGISDASANELARMGRNDARPTGGPRVFRVFLSSPADVQPEREAAERVVRRIGGVYADHVELRLERWEPKFYEATRSFQEQIESTTAFDLVVAIFWKRIGTELPPDIYRRPDGSCFESGSVLEVESAIEASVQKGWPAVFVFRKSAPVLFSKENFEQEKRQSDLLDAWWTRTFSDAAGHFRRASESFAATREFEDRFEDLLVAQLERSGVIPQGPIWDIATQGSPYPGLEPYDIDRRSVFFGRALAIRDARDEMVAAAGLEAGWPALFVIGPSGCGKSSLARAGIAPALTDPGGVVGVDVWRNVKLGVEASALSALAVQLYKALPELTSSPQHDPSAWARVAAGSPEDAADVICWALDCVAKAEQQRTGADRPIQVRLLLLIDQLERLFGAADDQASRFPAVLLALVRTGRVWLLLTVRSDRYAELQAMPELLELKRRGAMYDLPPPGEAEITDAVKGPARAAGLLFEPGERNDLTLPQALVHDTPSADALPLLQMTLARLFEERAGMKLTWNAYETMGGVPGAIAKHAQTNFETLSTRARAELRALVAALVRDVVRRAPGEFRFTMIATDITWESTEARRELAGRLVEARLLVLDEPEPDRKVLRAAHEAVLRQWAPARDGLAWIVDQELRRIRLQRARAWAAAGVFLFVAIAAGGLWRAAVRARNLALARQLAAQSDYERGQGADLLPRSVLLAIKSAQLVPLVENDSALRQAVALLPKQATAVASNGHIDAVAFSHDGRLVAIGSGGGTAVVFEAATGKERWRSTQAGAIRAVAFTSDRHFVATAGCDNTMRVFEADTGRELWRSTQDGPVNALAFREDGRFVATGSDDGTTRLFATATGAQLWQFRQGGPVRTMAFSADGRFIVSGSDDNTTRVFTADTGRGLWQSAQGGRVNAVAFSRNGRFVASGGDDNTVRVFQAATGTEVFQLPENNRVRAVAFSPDGLLLATGSDDFTTRVLEATSRKELWVKKQDNAVVVVAFSADGRFIASGSWDQTARVFATATGQELFQLNCDSPVDAIAFSPDGNLLVTGSRDNKARVWQLDNQKQIVTLAFSQEIAPGNDHGTAGALNTVSGNESSPSGQGSLVHTVVFSPDGRLVATSGDDRTTRVFESSTGREIFRLNAISSVNSIAFSSDGHLVATGGDDGTAGVFEASTRREISRLSAGGHIQAIAISPDGQFIAIGSEDTTATAPQSRNRRRYTLRIFKIDSRKQIEKMSLASKVVALAFSPNADLIAVGSDDSIAPVRVFETSSGKEFPHLKQTGWAVAVAFNSDGRLIATASDDGTVGVFEALSGKEVLHINLASSINALAFSSRSGLIATASLGNKNARVFDITTGREISRLTEEGDIMAVAFSSDSRFILTAERLADRTSNGLYVVTVTKELLRIKDLIDEACSRLNLTQTECQNLSVSD